MIRTSLVMFALAACCLVISGVSLADKEDEKPKHTIKEVMKVCMKDGLCKKVASGDASEEEKKKLLAMFQDLAKNKPPKGDADSWKKKTRALVRAAKGVAAGKAKATKALGKAANCKACHQAHKG